MNLMYRTVLLSFLLVMIVSVSCTGSNNISTNTMFIVTTTISTMSPQSSLLITSTVSKSMPSERGTHSSMTPYYSSSSGSSTTVVSSTSMTVSSLPTTTKSSPSGSASTIAGTHSSMTPYFSSSSGSSTTVVSSTSMTVSSLPTTTKSSPSGSASTIAGSVSSSATPESPTVMVSTQSSASESTTNLPTTTPPEPSITTDIMLMVVNMFDDLTMEQVLLIVLGCLIVLIIITLGGIFLVSIAHCRRYKKKKQPTALDIISKWEDTPNESSDIQLLSMKTIDEDEDKDGEEQMNDGVGDKEAGKEGSDETKKVNKEDDVTVGTFGFAEKAAESTASNAENPTTVTELEKKEDQDKKDEAAKVDKNEKLVEVTIEKVGEESATNISSGENPSPDNKRVEGTDTTVPTEKDKVQEETKLEPVPVQIPLLGKQVADEKAPDSEHAAEMKTPDQSDKPASPSKDQTIKPETSPSSNKNVLATESVSKEPETSATITKPQTEDVKTVSLASDKPASSATEGLSLFTNEDMEKALGAAASLDLNQVESTQL